MEYNNLIDQAIILDRADLTSTEKLVAVALLSFRNSETGRCNPPIYSDDQSKKTICSRTGFTKPCVIKAISSLEKKQIIICNKVNARPSEIIFTVNDVYRKQDLPLTTFTPTVNDDYRTVNDVYRHGKPRLPITNKEQIINKEYNKEDGGDTSVAPNTELPKKTQKEIRGTSFTLQTIPAEWIEVSEKLDPSLDAHKLFEEFADYWRAVPGSKGRKKDWLATFRNHIRNLPEWKRKNYQKPNQQKKPETVETYWQGVDYGKSGLL